jgi:hypothetical protein
VDAYFSNKKLEGGADYRGDDKKALGFWMLFMILLLLFSREETTSFFN